VAQVEEQARSFSKFEMDAIRGRSQDTFKICKKYLQYGEPGDTVIRRPQALSRRNALYELSNGSFDYELLWLEVPHKRERESLPIGVTISRSSTPAAFLQRGTGVMTERALIKEDDLSVNKRESCK
jgi:hypothetical protein